MRALATLLLLSAALAAPARVRAQPAVMTCAELTGQEIAGLSIASAAVETAGRPAPACHVTGTIRSTIGVEAWLPTEGWTGRLLQLGCGGLCGRINARAPQASGCVPFERGEFAVASTDLGHHDPSAASWGGDPERRLDFAFRAVHLTALASKALVARYYGVPARRTYFSGCSDGGREALLEALRYPDDFDGIVAGAPALDFTVQNTFHHGWTARHNLGDGGRSVLTADRLPVLHRLVLAACDGMDGAADGVLADPRDCAFDPRAAVCGAGADPAACLTAEEAAAAAVIYDGARAGDGRRLTTGGLMRGSEANWHGTVAPARVEQPPRALMFATDVLRHLAFTPPRSSTSVADLRFDAATYEEMAASRAVFDATNPDLSAFAARGGRLIVWHGWSDQDISPRSTLAFWAALRRTLGEERTDGFARLFLVPGLAHCRGGQGPVELDVLTPMLDWVERGAAPGALLARGAGGPRPVPAFPDTAVSTAGGFTVRAGEPARPEPAIGDARFDPVPPGWCIAGACSQP